MQKKGTKIQGSLVEITRVVKECLPKWLERMGRSFPYILLSKPSNIVAGKQIEEMSPRCSTPSGFHSALGTELNLAMGLERCSAMVLWPTL